MAGFLQIRMPHGKGSLVESVVNLEHNWSPKELKKTVRLAWNSIRDDMIGDFQAIPVPMKTSPYRHSHVNAINYRRQPGTLRKSVKMKTARASRVPAEGLPFAFMWLDSFPYNFLVSGTKERKFKKGRRKGKSAGQVPDRVNEQAFYNSAMPRNVGKAMNIISRSQAFRDPMRK